MKVMYDGANLALQFQYNPLDVERAKGIPSRRYDGARKLWVFKPTLANMEYVKVWFPAAVWDLKSQVQWDKAKEKLKEREALAYGAEPDGNLDGVQFRLPPFEHQRKALLLGRDKEAFAYLMDQGTGKTKVLIDDASHNFRQRRIDALIVIAPNSVKTNWVSLDGGPDEISKHIPPDVPVDSISWMSNPSNAHGRRMARFFASLSSDKGTLKVISVNVEALSTDKALDALMAMCKMRNVMIAVDESTRIKNRSAKRTKAAMKLRKECKIARIMSGTPLIKSPLNAFSQFNFLDEDVLGYSNYYAFQSRYAIMGGFEGRQVMRFQNLDELATKVAGISFRVLKEDCLDLPPKLYSKRIVELTPQQRKIYEYVKEREGALLVGMENLKPENVLTMLLRLQQVTSGFIPVIDEFGATTGVEYIEGANPKIEELMSIMEEIDGKAIIWCKFIPEIQIVSKALTEARIGHCLFYGDVSEADRVKAREAFQNDESTRVFVGQIKTGGIGLTLTAAKTVIYLSNTFSTEDRVQSEDRAHRIGQTKSVDYIDLVADRTVDGKILSVLRANKQVADEVMRDGYKEWI